MPMSYTGAGVVAPANNTDNTYTFFKPIFDYIFSTYGTFESTTNTAVAAAAATLATRTTLASATSLAQRDASADIAFRDVYGRSFVGSGIFYGGSLVKPFTDSNGFIRADALPTIPSYLVDHLQPLPTAVALQMANGAGYIYDTSRTPHQVASGITTYVPPSTSTQANWATTYVNTAAGTVGTIYALATSPSVPSTVLPVDTYAICHVYFPINAAGVIQAQAVWAGGTHPFFIDARPENFGGGGGGVGGGTGLSTADPVVSIGSLGDGTGEVDLFPLALGTPMTPATVNGNLLANWRVSPRMISDDPTYATMDDYLSVAVSGNIDGAITTAGGTLSMRVPAGQPPITFRIGRKWQLIDSTATVSTNTLSTPGWYVLVADLNGAGNRCTILLVGAVGTLQIGLRRMWFDGSNLYNTQPHGPYDLVKPQIGGANYTPLQQAGLYATTAALPAAGTTQLPGTSPVTFYLPDGGMTAWIEIEGHIVSTATPADFRVYGMSSNGVGTPLAFLTSCYTQFNPFPASSTQPFFAKTRLTGLGPGPVNFGMAYFSGQANYVIVQPTLYVSITSAR